MGPDAFKQIGRFDAVFKSPGIPPERLGEIENLTTLTNYFFEHCPCPIIGVTGTKGKGTTSTLIYELLKAGGADAYLGGNIGLPPLEFLGKLKKKSVVVLELSSFQTQDLKHSPHVAVILNTTSDHMDYHPTVADYHGAKANLLRRQIESDNVVVNADYPATLKIAKVSPATRFTVSTKKSVARGAFVERGQIILKNGTSRVKLMPTKAVALLGAHNLENVLPAVTVASLLDVAPQTIRTVVETFKGLPHRLEEVPSPFPFRFINDSFSTTPETSIAAVRSFAKPVHLIAGGSEKFSDFGAWAKACVAQPNLKTLILTGDQSAARMFAALKSVLKKSPRPLLAILRLRNLREAVIAAKTYAKPSDVILLSPACASFEEFPNYKVRGETFRKLAEGV